MRTRAVKYMGTILPAVILGTVWGGTFDAVYAAAPVDQTERTASLGGTHAATIAPAASAGWHGRYAYEFDGGRAAGGGAGIITYTLALDSGQCLLDVESFQTRELIVCTAKAGTTMIDILFKSYADGSTTDPRGNAVYSVGDPLFALERHGNALWTRWKGYPAPDGKPHRPGIFFRRQ